MSNVINFQEARQKIKTEIPPAPVGEKMSDEAHQAWRHFYSALLRDFRDGKLLLESDEEFFCGGGYTLGEIKLEINFTVKIKEE